MSSENLAVDVRGLSKSYRVASLRDRQNETGSGGYRRLVSRKYDHHQFLALRDVSFSVEQGEVLGIIGRNGAGKSTLLKILSRITPPDFGEVDIRGRVGSLLEVGTGFHPELTGRENVFLNATILGMRRREAASKFDTIVEFAGVEEFLDTPVKRYSSGMYIRLAFSVAAHLDAEILIVDEVLAVGDIVFQTKCLEKIEQLAKEEGRTVLFVSHNMHAVKRMCKRVLTLEHGRLVFDGPLTTAAYSYLGDATTAAGESVGSFDLQQRHNVHSSHELIFRRVQLFGPDGVPGTVASMGEAFTIEMECSRPVTDDQYIGVRLDSDLDQSVASFIAPVRDLRARGSDEPLTKISLRLPELTLTRGRYWVALGLWTGDDGVVLDEATRAAHFRVQAQGTSDQAFRVLHGEGLVVLPGEWTADPSDRQVPTDDRRQQPLQQGGVIVESGER